MFSSPTKPRRSSILDRLETNRDFKITLEWRLFIPCYPLSDPSKTLSPAIHAALVDILSVFNTFRTSGKDSETRTDSYIIGNSDFGLKFRNGEKVELKILQHRNDLGVEAYRKLKFGKKLKKYEEEIIEELHKSGHFEDHYYRDCMHNEHVIEVNKSRVTVEISNIIKVEICDLDLALPCNASKHWVSLAIEADKEVELDAFIASNGLLRRLIAAIHTYITLVQQARKNNNTATATTTTSSSFMNKIFDTENDNDSSKVDRTTCSSIDSIDITTSSSSRSIASIPTTTTTTITTTSPDSQAILPLLGGYPQWIEYIDRDCPPDMGTMSFQLLYKKLFR
jgi:hypothetical protein